MSLNNIYPQNYVHLNKGLLAILNTFVQRRNAATTLEDKVIVEGSAISLLKKLIEFDLDYIRVHWGELPTVDSFLGQFGLQKQLIDLDTALIRSLAEQYLQYFSSQQLTLMELMGKLKRIQQKMSVLNIWDIEKSKFVLGTSFDSLENLSFESLPGTALMVEPTSGVALLPLRNQVSVPVKNITIGSISNGRPGNSDIDVDVNVGLVQSLLTPSVEDWFEYERLDSGPCVLQLVYELNKEEIINHVQIIGIAQDDQKDFVLNSIHLVGKERKEIAVDQPVKSTNPEGLSVSFLPYKTKTIVFYFTQTDSYPINSIRGSQIASRERYSIGLQNIFLFQNEYDSQGWIASEKLTLPGKAFVCLPVVDYTKSKLVDVKLSISQDDAGYGEPALINQTTSSVLLTSKVLRWLLEIKRKDELFGLVSSLESEVVPTYRFLTKVVSRNETPTDIFLPLTNKLQDVFVYQPKLLRRGEKFEAHLLGRSIGTFQGFDLPIDVPTRHLSNFKIRVGGIDYDKVNTLGDLGNTKWSFSDDLKQIRFDDSLNEGSHIQISLDEDTLDLEERPDGFYQKIDMLFDPDPERVSLTILTRKTKWDSVVLPYDQQVIKLGVTNIQSGTFNLMNELTTFTEVFTLTDIYDAADNDYYVDYKNGILHLASSIGDKTVRAAFRWHPEVKLTSRVIPVFVDGKPWGIKIPKDALQGIEITETVGDAPSNRTDPITGLYSTRPDVFSGSPTRRVLTYDQIIRGSVSVSSDLFPAKGEKEIKYIDGVSEFLGLLQMRDEKTTAIIGTIVSFNLAAGGLWYPALGVTFSDTSVFTTKVASVVAVNSLGKYFIDPETGEVTVYTSGSLEAGIEITYYFRDPDFDPTNKYSVDYRNGILFSYSDMEPTATIRYKAASGRLSYDLVQELPYSLNGSKVSVSLERLKEMNNLVKIAFGEVKDNPDITELRRYYSPLVRMVGLRCA